MKSTKIIKKAIAVLMAVLLMSTPVLAAELVPVRATFEGQGWSVDWDAAHRRVIVTSPGGATYFIAIDQPGSIIENGRVYSPVDVVELLMFAGEQAQRVQDRMVEDVIIHGKLTRVTYGDNVAYLFGTMHAAQPHWFPLHPMAEEAMRRADVFAFEHDLAETAALLADPAVVAQIGAIQLLPDGLTLVDILPDDVYENFVLNLGTYSFLGITYENVRYLTPIALVMAIEQLAFTLLGVDFSISVDEYILSVALENNRPTFGLNTMLHEFEILFDVPTEIQAYALVDFPTFKDYLEAVADMGLIEMYAAQDIEGMREMVTAIYGNASDNPYMELFHYNLLRVRCHIFVDAIARFLTETEDPSTLFVAVGMLHIIGGCCGGIVLYLLEDMGFEVEPLWKAAQ
ncbi:MAG: TraB/GumN family protein [Defluviitaleaceae bacterium]|nr:TraB/GumN family protein [Defluviitaleaceae bacterium]